MKRLAAHFGLILAALTLAAPALGGNPATDQYRESVPNGSGDQSLGAKGHGARPVPLQPAIVQRLDSQAPVAAPILKAVATDPAAGAPAPLKTGQTAKRAHHGVGGPARASQPPLANVTSPSTASALFGTRAALFVALALAAAGIGFLLGTRRRPRRQD